ncbi:Imm51 family immunity protein [Limibacter armeniacum]|uniref:Imm51 family immunity protein n=1 Tax=Limibacter armeniacum TaxID=466084 RepID=UPI002FE5D198
MDNSFVDFFTSEEYQSVTVCFHSEKDIPFKFGEKLNEINEYAYMNGYNWAAVLEAYLHQEAPELLVDLEMMPEAGSCFMSYNQLHESNIDKAKRLVDLINDLVVNERELVDFVKNNGEEIAWD